MDATVVCRELPQIPQDLLCSSVAAAACIVYTEEIFPANIYTFIFGEEKLNSDFILLMFLVHTPSPDHHYSAQIAFTAKHVRNGNR